jgi:hypothetical protein
MNQQGARMRRKRLPWNYGLALAVALAVAACGDSGKRQPEATTDSASVPKEQPQQAATRGFKTSDSVKPGTLGPPGTGEKVAVTLTEWAITLSADSIGGGPATFVIENKGQRTHQVEVNNPHYGRWRTPPIPPGGVVEMSMALAFADFEIFCPMEDMAGNHREKGLHKVIRVR